MLVVPINSNFVKQRLEVKSLMLIMFELFFKSVIYCLTVKLEVLSLINDIIIIIKKSKSAIFT